MKIDWLIVGAGFTGAVLAERIASQLDQRVLLVERRDHIGGNAYDYYDEHGVLAHKYGPHIFHTNATRVWDYLSRFTEWRIYYHKVLGVIDGQQVPIPFNLNTLEALFPRPYADHLAGLLIDAFGYGKKIPILELRNASDGDLSQLADFIYDKVFKNYTQKQWELTPEELGPSVTARVPVFISRDNRYFQDRYQGMPKLGYTELFRRMLRHPNIRLLLNTDYRHVKEEIEYRKMVFTGPIDQYFDYRHGELPYRSLHFEMQHDKHKRVQPVGTVNYPNEFAFTRITEFKHLTGQVVPGTTTTIEYPQPHVVGENDPYYPIPKEEFRTRYKEYQNVAEKDAGRVLFAGRLADYRYYNMDQAVARALSLFDTAIR